MYKDVKTELYHGHRRIANNTYLRCIENGDGECIQMSLHGNIVAVFRPDYFQLFHRGWATTTTKDRLNLAISLAQVNDNNLTRKGKLLKFYKIYQVDYQWYYGNYHHYDRLFMEGMKINYKGRVIG